MYKYARIRDGRVKSVLCCSNPAAHLKDTSLLPVAQNIELKDVAHFALIDGELVNDEVAQERRDAAELIAAKGRLFSQTDFAEICLLLEDIAEHLNVQLSEKTLELVTKKQAARAAKKSADVPRA